MIDWRAIVRFSWPRDWPEPLPVSLTPGEHRYAAAIGRRRQAENAAARLKHRYGFAGDGLALHVKSAPCELAGAKGLDVVFRDTARGEPDLCDDIQIRGTVGHRRKLIVHPPPTAADSKGDNPRERFVLITSDERSHLYLVAGWLFGAEAQNPAYWDDPARSNRPAFFVPRNMLRPIETLFLPRRRDRYASPVEEDFANVDSQDRWRAGADRVRCGRMVARG